MSGKGWTGVGAAYARSFASLCEGAVDTLLDLTGGDDHLDVGCGTGVLARAAADRGRRVTALDADPEMVRLARETTGGRPVTVAEGSLPGLPLPQAAFDTVTANFVVNHLPDPRAGVRELARVARPGGRVAVTTWTNGPTAQSVLFAESLTAAGAVAKPGLRLPADLDYERSADGVAALLSEAGLDVAGAGEVEWEWAIAWDDLWAGISGGVGGIGETYLAQRPEVRARVEAQLRARAAGLETDGLVRLPTVAAYAVATARGPGRSKIPREQAASR